MDIATIIGLVAGVLCIVLSLAAGGDFAAFIDIPSLMIVVGGMLATTLMHFSLNQFLGVMKVAKKTLFFKSMGEAEVIQKMVNYAAINRRDGSLALENQISSAGDKFLGKGLRMIVDGSDVEQIEKELGLEVDNLAERHAVGKQVLEFMGASAPAFGMIGTLIGLVQMLGSMEDPSSIGAGMATALITTFYGAVIANLIFIPLAGKLGVRSKSESLMRNMIVEGVLAIASGEAPTIVRERMQTFLSNSKRMNIRPKI